MPPADVKFEEALKIFETQVGEATQFWFAAGAMNEVAKLNPDTLNAINLTPSFWITARVAMEYQAIITVGKIFGHRKANPHNIDNVFQVLREIRLAVFSKDALAARKRRGSQNADEWLPNYMKGVHVPTVRDVNRLHELSKRHRKTYETQYADVRNLHVAHTGIVDPSSRWAMFQKTRIRDFEKLVVFLNQFHDALWNMYYNGSRPTLRPMAYSVRSLVAKKLEDLSRNRNHEHIVAETRKCMFLITEAAKALPPGYKRSANWG
jgi:HEPN superfamily AbiU2-like protein